MRKDMAKKFFSRFLPIELREKADLSKLELVEGKHISDQGVTLYNDLLYKLLLNKEQVAYLYLMSEHQRAPCKHMHTRLLKYDAGAYEDCQRQKLKHIPIILHFVFYNGTEPWPYSTAFTDLYADPELVAKYLYMAPFTLIDVPSYLPADIEKDTEPGFCFAAFKATTTPDPYQAFKKFMQVANFEQHIRSLPADLKNIVTRYLVHFVDQKQRGLKDVAHLVSTNKQEEDKIMTSIAQAYKQQYTQQGIQEGMQQGMQQGMQKGMEQSTQAIAKSMLDRGYAPSEVKTLTRIGQEAISQIKVSGKPRRKKGSKAWYSP